MTDLCFETLRTGDLMQDINLIERPLGMRLRYVIRNCILTHCNVTITI